MIRLVRDPWVRLGAFAGLVFLAAGYVASTGTLVGEIGLVEFVNGWPDPVVDVLALVMQLGTRPVILIAAAVVAVVAPGDWRRAALAVALAGLLSWAAADFAKEIVERPRPAAFTDGLVFDHGGAPGFAYPSTHTAIAAGTLVAAALVARRGPAVALAVAALVGLGRIAVGVHFPLDVVGVPTVREPDGLALSSRNAYLPAADRPAAAALQPPEMPSTPIT